MFQMPQCFAYGCTHRTRESLTKSSKRRNKGVYSMKRTVADVQGPLCQLFSFPIDRRAFLFWERFCKRAEKKATSRNRLCSCHFVNHEKSAGPSLLFFDGRRPLDFPESDDDDTIIESIDREVLAEEKSLLLQKCMGLVHRIHELASKEQVRYT